MPSVLVDVLRGKLMVITLAQQNAKNLLSSLRIDDPERTLRRACAYTRLSVSGLKDAYWERAKGNGMPLEDCVRSLELEGVAPEMARRICGMPGLDSDTLKRRRDAASEDGPACSSKAARATPAMEPVSENDEGPGRVMCLSARNRFKSLTRPASARATASRASLGVLPHALIRSTCR